MTTNNHATDDQIISYLYRTISDADREGMDDHFVNCPDCRMRLTIHEGQQRQIAHDLKAAIKGASPSDRMTFGAIAPHLPRRRALDLLRLQLNTATPIFITVVGILFALIGLGQSLAAFFSAAELQPPGAFPTLAGFFFMFVSVEQLERALAIRPRFVIIVVLAGLLWLGTAIIGLLNILVIRDLSLWIFITLGSTIAQSGAATIVVMIVSAMIYIAAVIGGAEFHYKRIGQPSSWKLFAWTMGIQLLIMVLPHFVF